MRWITSFCILIFLSACSLYQSDGREAIEENSANIVTGSGFDSVQNITFICYQSGDAPAETKGPAEVIDNDFEDSGFASYLVKEKLLVHRVPNLSAEEAHHFCNLNTHGDLSKSKVKSAIHLGVQLLD